MKGFRILTRGKEEYNQTVNHVVQSWEWGEFRRKTGVKVIRLGKYERGKLVQGIQLTIHPLPFSKYTIGYLPKCPFPDEEMLQALEKIGKKENCIFIKLEPNVQKSTIHHPPSTIHQLTPSSYPLFTKYNFLIDLTQSEEELLKNMKQKTRYNIRLAQRKGVKVEEKEDKKSFETYLRLYFETCKRQKYFGHNERYHRLMWETLKPAGIAHLLIAYFRGEPLAAWMLFKFKDTLYYPYGGSSTKFRNVMASNLICWEAIRLGKKLGCKTFDLWGALGPNPEKSHPWYGWHRFKAGYGGKLVEYIGSYDLVLKPFLTKVFFLTNKIRWAFLRTTSYLPNSIRKERSSARVVE